MKKKLTLSRRLRIAEILSALGDGVGIDTKARLVQRQLGEPCSFGQALSLLSQLGARTRSAGPRRSSKTRAQINEERFQRHRALRPDLY